ncbi:MAG: hypothetical protein OCD00_07055 [Colwellia sp.]
MAELKQHAWLLVLLAFLLVAKFIIVPVYQWQDTQLAEISLLERKQGKISSVLKEKNNTAKFKHKLESALQQTDGLFFPFQEDAKFKLNQQKMLESLLSKYNLTVQHVGWQVARSKDSLLLTSYPILIRFSGKTTDAIKFLAAIEMNSQRIGVEEFNFSFKRQSDKALGRINGSVTLMLFMEKELNSNQISLLNKQEPNAQNKKIMVRVGEKQFKATLELALLVKDLLC